MAKSKASFGKREKEKDKIKKRQEKEEKRLERKNQVRDGNNLDAMLAYVDENGNISSTPPDGTRRKEVNAEDIVIGVPKHEEVEDNNTQRSGIVIMYNDKKGFGFIRDLVSGEEIFVHANNADFPLKQNGEVSFEVEKDFRGKKAVNVTKPKSNP